MNNKEKLVRDLLSTFDDRNDLHEAYKKKMKEILENFIYSLVQSSLGNKKFDKISLYDLREFINLYIENHCRPEK